ncbi:CHAP domain-containing protein [Tautonia rosea]|uniref:CHAP domain-containing protein n=1 Tax=Tautonia rosea TaxID=2728037 RepID=UPI001473210E|nr:CHAP domain-containing protein [Tautonia rosea]
MVGCLFLIVLAVSEPEPPDLATRIVSEAEARLGERVGDGTCSDLVAEVLREAGATLGASDWEQPWGRTVQPSERLQPGDVLVFRDAVFVHKERKRSGAVRTTTAKMERHVAIVSAVQRREGTLRIALLHQNAGRTLASDERRQVVQRWVLDPKELTEGTISAYRPMGVEEAPDTRPFQR